jgi:hypothetical protein
MCTVCAHVKFTGVKRLWRAYKLAAMHSDIDLGIAALRQNDSRCE